MNLSLEMCDYDSSKSEPKSIFILSLFFNQIVDVSEIHAKVLLRVTKLCLIREFFCFMFECRV